VVRVSFVPRENLIDAIKRAIEYAPRRNFKQSVEMIVVLRDVDPRSPEGRIREIVFLPHPPKKHVTIITPTD
jgi:large subunit ribosomal protein L1